MPDLFGVAVSPYDLDDWEAATGIKSDCCMVFEAWSKQRPLTDLLGRLQAYGHHSFVLTWEPWQPTPVGVTAEEQGTLQPAYSHDAILRGDWDWYIDMIARNLRDCGMTVYLRLMHEMNGNWYPWSNNPAKYIEAWKYIRYRMRSMRGAWNVKFCWAPNPDLWRSTPADWLKTLLPYWPGNSAVEFYGSTMIEYAYGDRNYPVSQFANRFRLAREIFQKQVLAMEVNVAHEVAVDWLTSLAGYICDGDHPLPLLVLSQGTSRGAAAGSTGTMDWSAMTDAHCREAIKAVVSALHAT